MDGINLLLQVVDAYRLARSLSDARVSTLVFNDGSKIKSLRGGRDIGVNTLNRSLQWFSDHWPENAVWPAGFERPAPTPVVEQTAEA